MLLDRWELLELENAEKGSYIHLLVVIKYNKDALKTERMETLKAIVIIKDSPSVKSVSVVWEMRV